MAEIKMAEIKAVSFDLEGNLANLEKLHFGAFLSAANAFGLKTSFEEIVEKIPNAIGGGDENIAQGLSIMLEEQATVAEIRGAKDRYFKVMLSEKTIAPRAGAAEAVKWFAKNGFAIAIGSLTPKARAMHILQSTGLIELFDSRCIVLEEDVERIKPAPDVYLETAKRMGVHPREQLVFDDSPAGLHAALLAGSRAIAMPVYNGHEHMLHTIGARPKRIFWSWVEINLPALIENLNNGE